MTQKKTPTPEQIQEYRRICETAVTSEDYAKVNAFTDEYDTFTYVFEESGRMGVKDAAGEVLVPALFDDVAYTFADFFRGTAVAVIRSGKMAGSTGLMYFWFLTRTICSPRITSAISM